MKYLHRLIRRGEKMAKKYYYDGKLYSEKDWDFDRKRPKTKVKEKKADKVAEPETQVEVVADPAPEQDN